MRTDAHLSAAVAPPASDSVPRSSVIEIGELHIDLDMRRILRRNETLAVGARAFDILAVLARANGRLVSKDELMSAVWPRSCVEENNVQVHVSGLRKLLGDDRDLLVTVPRRGYQLVRRRHGQMQARAESGEAARGWARNRVADPRSTIGRAASLATLDALLDHTRVVTLVGAGGVGKSTLAAEAARRAAARWGVPLYRIPLAGADDRQAVHAALARHLEAGAVQAGAVQAGAAPLDAAALAAALGRSPALVLIDDAEHVIGPVAELVDALMSAGDDLRVIVTSREPLRIVSETLLRVDPLDVPSADASDAELEASASVQLFTCRARAMQPDFDADGAALALVGAICRRLGGLPLAIELAAARLTALGLADIHRRLNDPLTLLAGGYRTALPRHRTLRASFDWSYQLLDASQQALLRRSAGFDAAFTLEALCAAAREDRLSMERVVDGASQLVAKSLVAVEFDGACTRYRLPDITRAYAREKSGHGEYAHP